MRHPCFPFGNLSISFNTNNFLFIVINSGSVSGEDVLVPSWKECSNNLKETLGSVVVPLGALSVGLCRHRALLFKVRSQFCLLFK